MLNVVRSAWVAAILGVLAGCAEVPHEVPPQTSEPAAPRAAPSSAPAMARPSMLRAHSRWIAVDWAELPGWDADRSTELWPALLRSCERAPSEWLRVCADARKAVPPSDAAARAWLQQRLQPFRIESLDGVADGLVTGYFEPLVAASRTRRGAFQVPLYMLPADLASRRPYWTRQQVDTLPAAQQSLRGLELAYLADPLDALILQIQGSGRMQLSEADGRSKLVRAAYAGHNDHPYKSVGRWLVEQGELKPDQASWAAIKA